MVAVPAFPFVSSLCSADSAAVIAALFADFIAVYDFVFGNNGVIPCTQTGSGCTNLLRLRSLGSGGVYFASNSFTRSIVGNRQVVLTLKSHPQFR